MTAGNPPLSSPIVQGRRHHVDVDLLHGEPGAVRSGRTDVVESQRGIVLDDLSC